MNIKLARMLGRLYREEEGGTGGGGEGGNPPGGSGNIVDPAKLGPIPSFKEMIPAEFKDNPTLAQYNDIGALIKSHISAQSLIGSSIQLPKEGDAEGLNKVYDKLGRPKTPDEYSFNLGEEIKVESLNPDLMGWAKGAFHKAGLNPQQANELLKGYVGLEQEMKAKLPAQETPEQIEAKYFAEMETMFGDKYDETVLLAERAGTTFLDEDTKAWLLETGLGNHPQFVKTFAKIGQLLKEDENFSNEATGNGFVGGEAEAKMEIGRLNSDPDFMKAYQTKDAPGHQAAVEKMSLLYKKAYPGKIKS